MASQLDDAGCAHRRVSMNWLPFGNDARGEGRRLAASGLGFSSELSAASHDFLRSGDDIGHLEREADGTELVTVELRSAQRVAEVW